MSAEIIDRLQQIKSQIDKDREVAEKDAVERENRLVAKIASLQDENQGLRADVDKVLESIKDRNLSLPGIEEEKERFSINRLIRGMRDGNVEKIAPFELDVHRETMKRNAAEVERRVGAGGERALSTLSDTAGGFFVPQEIVANFYEKYRSVSVRGSLGVTEIRPGGSPVIVNKKTGNTVGYRTGEGEAFSASDIALGRMTLTPKKVAARTFITDEALLLTDPDIDQITERDILQTLDLKMDLDLIEGSGGSNTPIGILNTTGVVNLALNSGTGAYLDWSDVLALEGAVEDANALVDDGSLHFLSVPGVFRNLRKQRTVEYSGGTEGAYIFQPGQSLDDVMPWPCVKSTQITTAADANSRAILFGRFSDVFHAVWGGLMIARSDSATDGTYNAFTQGGVHVKATAWDDVGVIRPTAIVYTDDAKHN